MKRQVITQLTTAERLTLLEQIHAPQGERSCVEFASCALSDMEFLFDFEEVTLVEMKWPRGECEWHEVVERTNLLLSPETEQKFGLGMPYFVHAVLPPKSMLTQAFISRLKQDESVALEHLVTTSDTDGITIRVANIKNEIGNKIADEIEKENRIINS